MDISALYTLYLHQILKYIIFKSYISISWYIMLWYTLRYSLLILCTLCSSALSHDQLEHLCKFPTHLQCRACCMKLVFIEESCVSCITELPGRTWRTPANNFIDMAMSLTACMFWSVMDRVPKNTLWPQTSVKKSKRMGKTQGKFRLELPFGCCDILAPRTKGTHSSKDFKRWKFHHLHSATSRTSLNIDESAILAVPSVAALALGCLELQLSKDGFNQTMIPGYWPIHICYISISNKVDHSFKVRRRFVPVLFVCGDYYCC